MIKGKGFTATLHDYAAKVDAALVELRDQEIMPRIWRHDHTVWKPDPTEISNRLGWLHSPESMVENIAEIRSLVDAVRKAGYTHALLLGMGGSSLAPEVFQLTFGIERGYLDLGVLDSTAPEAVLACEAQLDLKRTLFIVSTKSGGTVETFSFFKYFYNRVSETVGEERAGEHFIAITDDGSGLVDVAEKHGFRKIFLNDPNIGGRYSVLSYFGLVPAALIGMNVQRLLQRARSMAHNCEGTNSPVEGDNTGAWLGVILGELALSGRDKVTLIASPRISSFGAWVEQLIAESTGKEGSGILPVDLEELAAPESYSQDRLFVYLHLNGDTTYDDKIDALKHVGQPVVQLELQDIYDLGGEFFRWEVGTVVAGQRLGINPFDQPNVESAKVLARKMVATFQEKGTLPAVSATLDSDGVKVYTDLPVRDLQDALTRFVRQAQYDETRSGGTSYVALQAYVRATPETERALNSLRHAIRDKFKLATTVGYGPRFLHSTGQLHKGDAGNGLFIQITAESEKDTNIPEQAGGRSSAMTFGVLIMAQALGDRQALIDAGRKVIRFHFSGDVAAGITQLEQSLASAVRNS